MDYKSGQAIGDLTAEYFGLAPIPIDFRNVRTALARHRTRRITIPTSLFNDKEEQLISFIVHEVCHFVNRERGGRLHDKQFKDIEDEGLALWDLSIVRSRAYAKKLFHKGELVWERMSSRLPPKPTKKKIMARAKALGASVYRELYRGYWYEISAPGRETLSVWGLRGVSYELDRIEKEVG